MPEGQEKTEVMTAQGVMELTLALDKRLTLTLSVIVENSIKDSISALDAKVTAIGIDKSKGIESFLKDQSQLLVEISRTFFGSLVLNRALKRIEKRQKKEKSNGSKRNNL